MSMIATGGPAAPPLSDHLPQSPCYPSVSFAAYRAASRIDRTASDPQAFEALRRAVSSINGQLATWFLARMGEDPAIETLTDIEAPAHQPTDFYEAAYLRAVHCHADALLTESYRDFDSSAEGDRRADAMEGRIDAYRREAQYAVADITGVARRRIELL